MPPSLERLAGESFAHNESDTRPVGGREVIAAHVHGGAARRRDEAAVWSRRDRGSRRERLVVSYRAPRLDNGPYSGIDQHPKPIREGKEGIRSSDGSLRPTGGTFDLTFRRAKAANIPYNATRKELKRIGPA